MMSEQVCRPNQPSHSIAYYAPHCFVLIWRNKLKIKSEATISQGIWPRCQGNQGYCVWPFFDPFKVGESARPFQCTF